MIVPAPRRPICAPAGCTAFVVVNLEARRAVDELPEFQERKLKEFLLIAEKAETIRDQLLPPVTPRRIAERFVATLQGDLDAQKRVLLENVCARWLAWCAESGVQSDNYHLDDLLKAVGVCRCRRGGPGRQEWCYKFSAMVL
jgi:hypothetical protein